MRYVILCVLAVLLSVGCGSTTENGSPSSSNAPGSDNAVEPAAPATPATPAVRTAAVAPSAELFSRVEGANAKNDCASDSDCKPSGCSKEVCAAEELMTACDVQAWPQGDGASCGCVDKQCVWYR
jgi:eight-cysteine-cluster-containing protein